MSESESGLDPELAKLVDYAVSKAVAELANNPPVPFDWLTPAEAAQYLRCSEIHVTHLRLAGELKCFQPKDKNGKGHKGVRFHRVDHLEAYLRAGVAS